MPICQYFLRGQCKFGSSCRNEHPVGAKAGGGFGSSSWTTSSTKTAADPASFFTQETINRDINPSRDKPLWPLSSYGPAKYQATLIPGLDESPEELRVKATMALKDGKVQEYVSYEASRISVADNTFSNARANISQLHSQAVSNFHNVPPTSSGFHSSTEAGTSSSTSSVFGTPAKPSVFGQPTGFGALASSGPSAFGGTTSSSTFGQPAFGQPSFGQPSAFGKPAQSIPAFGQSTSSSATAFGQPAPGVSAFGQPSTFGQPQPTQPSAFGQPSQPTTAFGQPSFGQTSTPQSSVIKPASGAFSNLTETRLPPGGGFSAFAGQPNAFAAAANAASTTPSGAPQPVFGQSAFGNITNTTAATTTPSAFGAPSVFGTQAQPQVQSAFGSLAAAAPSAFVTSVNANAPPVRSVFGSPAAQVQSAFVTPQQQQVQSAFVTSQSPPSTFGQASAFGAQTQGGGFAAAAVSKTQDSKPDFATVKSVSQPTVDTYDEGLPENYMQLIPQVAREAFETPKFQWGNIPEWLPPKELR